MVSFVLPAVLAAVLILGQAIRILREYERGVVFRLGRLIGLKGPGFLLLIPGVDKMVKVDLRRVTLDVPVQDVITKDNVPAKVNAVCYFRVLDPSKAVNQIQNFMMATSQIAQTTLRSVVGQAELDELLSERDKINQRLQKIIDQQTDSWGIKVSVVEVKDVLIPEKMQRAIAPHANSTSAASSPPADRETDRRAYWTRDDAPRRPRARAALERPPRRLCQGPRRTQAREIHLKPRAGGVRFHDVNGSRGGVDIECRVRLVMSRGPDIIVRARGTAPREAYDLAIDSAERALRRQLGRRHRAARAG